MNYVTFDSEGLSKLTFLIKLCSRTYIHLFVLWTNIDNVSVNSRMSGYPVPQVTWLKDNMSIDSNLDYHTKVEEGGLCSLTIDETFTEDSACFTCRATNPLGFAETTALLTVRGTDQYFNFTFAMPENIL